MSTVDVPHGQTGMWPGVSGLRFAGLGQPWHRNLFALRAVNVYKQEGLRGWMLSLTADTPRRFVVDW